jgi:hypothetical protein
MGRVLRAPDELGGVSMKARELFAVGVRLIGVWFWSQSVYWAFWAYMKNAQTGLGNPVISANEDLAYACLYLLLGTALFVGCNGLVLLAYGGPRKTVNPDEAPPAA